ncbi:hypothetical protein GCM10027277_07230 [Pseudoduganella ginsengisoli]|uniref:Uncharacterized protein n=1 Tax=Pseudoduganella ginsengisoli TaxID=1462440 RepID=A0A6L6Q8G2_9BURK|nr:hypothetical protein [Pseudoduganella ginsengisoli]MTW05920.1 hypothetical protein [Pseudoduganella ginsengisoli]
MAPHAIPDDIRRFIMLRIPSIPYLEALLLMRENPSQAWNSHGLAQRLYLPIPDCDALLEQLHKAGVAAPAPGMAGSCRYAPAEPRLAGMLDQLARVYARNLVEVSTLIHSKTNKKAQLFADAFVWRKDK